MNNILKHLKDVGQGKAELGNKRSGQWPAVEKAHLEKQPNCMVCNRSEKLNVHHIKPFHIYPDLELDPSNLITLCESDKGGVNCHLHYGHLGNFKSFNENVIPDASLWNQKIKNRP